MPDGFRRAAVRRAAPEDLVALRRRASSRRWPREAWAFLAERKPGAPKIRFESPRRCDRRAAEAISVIEIVNDDMPFLVDSVMAELTERGLDVAAGRASDLRGRARQGAASSIGAAEATRRATARPRESFIHIHVERIDDAARRAEIVQALEQVLAEVRLAVQDWRPMLGARRRGHRGAEGQSAAAAGRRDRRGDPVPGMAGRRQFHLPRRARLRSSPARAATRAGQRDRARHAARARRAGVHARRPGGDDHAGDPRLLRRAEDADRHQGERASRACTAASTWTTSASSASTPTASWSASSASSGCSPRPPTRARPARSRICAARSTRCCARAGFDPDGHSGKALVNVLETYPRDELFQIDEDTLYRVRAGDPAARRASARARAGAARPVRPLRVGAGLCAARALRPRGPRADRRVSRRGLQGPRQRLLSVLPGRAAGARAFHHRPRRRRDAQSGPRRRWKKRSAPSSAPGPTRSPTALADSARARHGRGAVRALSRRLLRRLSRGLFAGGRGRRHPRHRRPVGGAAARRRFPSAQPRTTSPASA